MKKTIELEEIDTTGLRTESRSDDMACSVAIVLLFSISFSLFGSIGLILAIIPMFFFMGARENLSINTVPFVLFSVLGVFSYCFDYSNLLSFSIFIGLTSLFNIIVSNIWLDHSMANKPIMSHDNAMALAEEHTLIFGTDVGEEGAVYLRHRYGTSSEQNHANAAETFTNYLYIITFFGVMGLSWALMPTINSTVAFFVLGFIFTWPKNAMPSYCYDNKETIFLFAIMFYIVPVICSIHGGRLDIALFITLYWAAGLFCSRVTKRYIYSAIYTIG